MNDDFMLDEFATDETITKGEEALQAYVNTINNTKQIDQHIPIIFYIVFGLLAIGGWFAAFYLEFSLGTLFFACFSSFLFSVVYLLPLGLKIYMAIGPTEYDYAVVDKLGESDVNYTSYNGKVKTYPCLYMHLSNGEPICYEFGNKKPCREFRKGERIEVKLKGGFYNPVEKLY